MDDRQIIEAFVGELAVAGFGPKLHIENDCLLFDGWWHAAFRIASTTFALRDEAPPEPTSFLQDFRALLRSHDLQEVPADPSLMVAITYTSIDLGLVEWSLWSTDLATAEADLAARAGRDLFFSDAPGRGTLPTDWAAGICGLRRVAGLAPLVVLAVGIPAAAVAALSARLENCSVESRALGDPGELGPSTCQALTPNLVLIDATAEAGKKLARELRDQADDRLLPIVALATAEHVAGADVVLDPASDPADWADHIRNLLP